MIARIAAALLIVGLVGLAAAIGFADGGQARLALASFGLFGLGALAVGMTGGPPLDRAARGGLFLTGLGSLGLAVGVGGAMADWSVFGYVIGGGALGALGSLIAGIALARMAGRAQVVGVVLLCAAIPLFLGASVGAGDNLPFFVLGAGILAAGYVGVGLLALGPDWRRRKVNPG